MGEILCTLEQLPEKFRDMFDASDKYHSVYFWYECAENWQREMTHKVYVLYSEDKELILGFFSIVTWKIEGRDSSNSLIHFPILDIPFFGINNYYEDNDGAIKIIANILIEKIDAISKDLINKVGCRFIRFYIPYSSVKENNQYKIDQPYISKLLEIFKENEIIDPDIDLKQKQRPIYVVNSGDSRDKSITVHYLKYFLFNLKFE